MTLMAFKNINEVEAGIDEAGRGCLFGRVYIAAVIWPQQLTHEPPYEIKDSKKVTPKRRHILRQFIETHAIDYNVAYLEHDEIDQINILQATLKGMHKSLNGLNVRPTSILVDGNKFNPYQDPISKQYIPHECIISGDNKYLSIAAASILAKEYHDEYIQLLCDKEPELNKYNLTSNKGYATKSHRNAIKQYGITPYHRMSFKTCNPNLKPKQKQYTQTTLGNVFSNYNITT